MAQTSFIPTPPQQGNSYTPSYETIAGSLIGDLGQNRPGEPIPGTPADNARIALYHAMIGTLNAHGGYMPPPLTAAQRDQVETNIYQRLIANPDSFDNGRVGGEEYYKMLMAVGVTIDQGASGSTVDYSSPGVPMPGSSAPPIAGLGGLVVDTSIPAGVQQGPTTAPLIGTPSGVGNQSDQTVNVGRDSLVSGVNAGGTLSEVLQDGGLTIAMRQVLESRGETRTELNGWEWAYYFHLSSLEDGTVIGPGELGIANSDTIGLSEFVTRFLAMKAKGGQVPDDGGSGARLSSKNALLALLALILAGRYYIS